MRPRAVVLVTSLAVAPLSWPAAASPQLRSTPTVPDRAAPTPGRVPDATWDTFSADVTIRRHLVKADGTPRLQGPEFRYRWVRRLDGTGWKSTMSLVSASPDTIVTDKGPQPVSRKIPISRLEFGDPSTAAKVFDREGRMVFMLPTSAPQDGTAAEDAGAVTAHPDRPTAAVRAALASTAALVPALDGATAAADDPRSREWVEQLMPRHGDRAARRAALVRGMGAVQGVERGLERFVSHRDGATTEVLTDPGWAVPVEINVARDGRLVSHTVFGYLEDPGAGLVRRRMRSELLVSPESGDRAVIDVELADIRLTRGGGR
jgi:hypothetical protein